MPNWCSNHVTLTGPKEKIDLLIAELKKSDEIDTKYEILNTLRPNPSGEWEYGWCVSNWGTKWDVTIGSYEIIDETTVSFSFESAWSPPTVLYQFLTDEGWTVDAYYYEPGIGFCGHYLDGDDDCYEYSGMSLEEIKDTIPSDIDDMFGIIDDIADWYGDDETEVG